jgi:hypothetical protein
MEPPRERDVRRDCESSLARRIPRQENCMTTCAEDLPTIVARLKEDDTACLAIAITLGAFTPERYPGQLESIAGVLWNLYALGYAKRDREQK